MAPTRPIVLHVECARRWMEEVSLHTRLLLQTRYGLLLSEKLHRLLVLGRHLVVRSYVQLLVKWQF